MKENPRNGDISMEMIYQVTTTKLNGNGLILLLLIMIHGVVVPVEMVIIQILTAEMVDIQIIMDIITGIIIIKILTMI